MLYVFSEAEAWASGAAVALMVMDIVTGFAGSIITRTFKSSKMREGLGHKFLVLCIMAVAVMLEVAGQHVAGLPFEGVALVPVSIYVIVMEVGSIFENIVKAYPALADTPLIKLFVPKEGGER